MAPSRTSTVKSKHAANGSGIRNSKTSSKSFSKSGGNDGVVKARSEKSKKTVSQGVSFKQQSKKGPGGANAAPSALSKLKKKRRVYTEKELGIQELNCITPVGVEKPKGKKKGKVFVDDRESMLTLLALVHAEKDGQIESKMMKARQMEEIREARKNEQEKKVEDRKARLDETKEGLRKKRKRSTGAGGDGGGGGDVEMRGTKPLKLKKKTVSFA